MGEKAVLSVNAHVFQIDPETKKKWLPTSGSSVRVTYYHDPSRKTYRIIAIEGGKPLINSTVTANMTFTKTSPKFGQWSDHRANTVYGLGFSSEKDLLTFADKFTEAKTAARILLEERKRTKTTADITANDGLKDDPEPELPSNISPNPVTATNIATTINNSSSIANNSTTNIATPTTNTTSSTNGNNVIEHLVQDATVSSQQIESLKFENNKLKVALANSAQNVKKWESEMQTLRNNNAMLTTALEESTQHVAEWKRQLQKYKEECDHLRKKVNDDDNNSDEMKSIKEENTELKEVLSDVQIDLEQKTEESNSKDVLITELTDKVTVMTSENKTLTNKTQELQNIITRQEETNKQKYSFIQQKNNDMEAQLSSILSLQKELSKLLID